MKKIKMFGGLAGLVLGTTILSGCTTTDSNMSGWDALNIFAMGKSTNSQEQAAANLSAIAGTMAQREQEIRVAREGRSQVNQNNNAYYGNSQPYQQAQPKPIVAFVVYNFVHDRNSNGATDYPDEYIGVEKSSFSKNERIEIAAHLHVSGTKGKTVFTQIKNPNKKVIYNEPYEMKSDFMTVRVGENGDLMPYLMERGGLGTYSVEWFIDGRSLNSSPLEFGVVE